MVGVDWGGVEVMGGLDMIVEGVVGGNLCWMEMEVVHTPNNL